jgi:hypothetical protein
MSDHAAPGHGSHGEAHDAPLGAINLAAWGAGALGIAIGLLTATIIAAAAGAL